jgi:adenylate kinase family enzyme
MRRVAILASASGSGKTTLGRSLAASLGVPFVELDSIHHQAGWRELTAEELRREVEPIVALDAWVIDGAYRGKLGDLVLERADAVVWLDLPRRIWLPRLVCRTLRRIVRRERLWNDNRETLWNGFFARDSLLRFALRTYEPRRRDYPTALGRYNLIRLRSPREIEQWLEGVS